MAHHITVFAENRPGRIERVTRVLGEKGVNIRAIAISTSDAFGVIKLLVDDPGAAYQALAGDGLSVYKREIVVVVMEDRPGGLHDVAAVFREEGVNIEDAYGFVIHDRKRAALVVETGDVPGVTEILARHGIAVLSDEEIYAL